MPRVKSESGIFASVFSVKYQGYNFEIKSYIDSFMKMFYDC